MNEELSEQQLSKKERREMRRQEARDDNTRRSRGQGAKRAITWLVVVGVLVGIGWLVMRAAQNSPGHDGGGATISTEVTESDNVKGPDDAVITLIEYGDYQCPACAAFHPIVEQLFEESEGQIRVVFRHFPLKSIHPNAVIAARAVQAAAVQGKFWEMHSLVFDRQTEWSPIPRNSARNKMIDYAVELGLDGDQLDEDMDSSAVKDKVDSDLDGGNSFGVSSTPSFFVNGVKLENFNSLEEFRSLVFAPLNAVDSPEVDESMTETHGDGDTTEGEPSL